MEKERLRTADSFLLAFFFYGGFSFRLSGAVSMSGLLRQYCFLVLTQAKNNYIDDTYMERCTYALRKLRAFGANFKPRPPGRKFEPHPRPPYFISRIQLRNQVYICCHLRDYFLITQWLAIPLVDWEKFDGCTYHTVHIQVYGRKLGGVLRKGVGENLRWLFVKIFLIEQVRVSQGTPPVNTTEYCTPCCCRRVQGICTNRYNYTVCMSWQYILTAHVVPCTYVFFGAKPVMMTWEFFSTSHIGVWHRCRRSLK